MRIGLVGCVKKKGPVAAPAGELYTSPLFVGRRRFVEASCDRWFVLPALHGLVDPDEMVEPYDESLVSAGVGERRVWAQRVLASIEKVVGDLARVVFEVHARATYRDFGLVEGLVRRGAVVVVPAAGLSQGRQLAFYAGSLGQPSATGASVPVATTVSQGGSPGGYAALPRWLEAIEEGTVTTRFAEIETLLGRSLPASARRHRAWWANNDRSRQARAWFGAGWRVASVDMASERVRFERVTT